ncbi:ATP-binding protein [Haloarchaeobius amylolyticus]|uniref:ATP-binding protein n=1 Tax=Haloarchaeobius amylolyticus TaxID=1198296 RepID=UPI00226DE48E|nr:ATP-binding protein [Haloarchaeobius amylolyticus]
MIPDPVLFSIVYDSGTEIFSRFRKGRTFRKAVADAAEATAADTPGISSDDLLDIFQAELDEEATASADTDEILSDLAYALKVRANTTEDVDFEATIERFLVHLEENLVAGGQTHEIYQILYEYVRHTNTLTETLVEEIEQRHERYYDDLDALSRWSNRMAPSETAYQIPEIDQHVAVSGVSTVESELSAGENVILTGPAGVGKTGVLAEQYATLADEHPVYFIDAREFGQFEAISDVEAEFGITNSLRDLFQEVADRNGRCTVVVDQLDNIRIETAATVFQHLLLDLSEMDQVGVLCACRTWDLEQPEYQRLNEASQFTQIELEPLDEAKVSSLLSELGVDSEEQPPALLDLCQRLLNLTLLADVIAADAAIDPSSLTTETALWDAYRESLDTEGSGPSGTIPTSWEDSPVDRCVYHARSSLRDRTTTFEIEERNPGDGRLRSRGTIVNDWRRRYRFKHDQLQSYFYAWDAVCGDFSVENVLEDGIDERVAADVFDWMFRMYLADASRSTSFIRDGLGSDSDLGFYAKSILAESARDLGPKQLPDETSRALLDSLNTDQNLTREFYRNLSSPAWARYLVDNERVSEFGSHSAAYVSELAGTHPELVIDALATYDTPDRSQLHPYLSVVDSLPPTQLTGLTSLIVKYLADLDRETSKRMHSNLSTLVGALIRESQADATLELLSALLESAVSETTEVERGEYSGTRTEVHCRLRPRSVQSLFDEYGDELVATCGMDLLDVLDEQFRSCLDRVVSQSADELPPERLLRRRLVANRLNPTKIEVVFVQVIEDVLGSLLVHDASAGSAWVRRYLEDDGIFKQMAISVLARHPERAPELVSEVLTTAKNVVDHEISTEYISLLDSGFGVISEVDQKTVLKHIDEAPDEEDIRERLSDRREFDSTDELDRMVDAQIDRWKLKRLYHVRDAVSNSRQTDIQSLIDEYGEIEYQAGTGYHFPFQWGDDDDGTPFDPSELDADAFISACREHAVPHHFEEESKEDTDELRALLNEELHDRLRNDPATYLPHLPEIVRAGDDEFVNTAFEAVKSLITNTDYRDTTIEAWGSILEALAMVTDIGTDERLWPRDTRRTAAELVQTIISHTRSSLPVAEYEEVLSEVLMRQLQDPDPERTDAGWNQSIAPQNPIFVKGVRPTGVVATTYFFASLNTDTSGTHQDLWDRIIALFEDSARPVRFALGMRLPLLFYLNDSLVRAHMDALFPEDSSPEAIRRFTSAWEGYLTITRLSQDLFADLRSKYERAIDFYTADRPDAVKEDENGISAYLVDNTADTYDERTYERVCSHLASAYAQEFIEASDPLIERAFALRVAELDGENIKSADLAFARTFTDLLNNTDNREFETMCWERAIEFWEIRLEYHDTPACEGFRGYAELLEHAPPSASVTEITDHLVRSAPCLSSSFPFQQVIEFLANEVNSSPTSAAIDDATSVLVALVDQWDTSFTYPASDDRWTIVKVAAANGNDQAIKLAERFYESGESEYRRIIDQHKTADSETS